MPALILAVDTSGKSTSIAVAKGSEVIASAVIPPDEKRSETLWSDVRSLLTEAGLKIEDIDVFAVCIGPGGFTGLRVGMAALKGLSMASRKPLIGVTSLQASAYGIEKPKHVCVMINAYKSEVYSQLFTIGSDGVPNAENEPSISNLEDALRRVASHTELVFVGDGAAANWEKIDAENAQADKQWVLDFVDRRLAESIAQLAYIRYERDETETPESLKACYVRPSEAEIKLSLGLLGSKIKRSMKQQ
jgi:tRNA threonylcarbamoyladenosine biosynthesis protein TsaB